MCRLGLKFFRKILRRKEISCPMKRSVRIVVLILSLVMVFIVAQHGYCSNLLKEEDKLLIVEKYRNNDNHPESVLTNYVDCLNNGDKVLVNFLSGKGMAKNVHITKSEDRRYLYYHMKFTNQHESCILRIDKKNGEAVTVKKPIRNRQ